MIIPCRQILNIVHNLSVKEKIRSILPSRPFMSTMPSKYPIDNQPHLKVCGEIVKSPNDRRDYRPLTLKNGIRVLLISDKQEDSSDDKNEKLSAAGLCINVGSFSDPPDLPGLAHFLEHMVFMGSSKYPDENDFEAFLSKHGGHSNAYTDVERTVFYFEVHQIHFAEALDRFAHFFSESLLKKDTIDREIEAVDKEFCMSKLSDGSRLAQIHASLAKPGHPMGKFMWGNSLSLKTRPIEQGIDIHSRLRDFYHRLYSSKYMTLAVQSKDCLDDLETWVRESFSPVKDNGLEEPTFHHLTEPFDTADFYKFYKVVPVKKMHQIELTWSMPASLHLYHVKPLHYLGWLIGHEGKGSLLAYLKSKCWAISLSAGNNGQGTGLNSTLSWFSISVQLTETGFQNYEKVLDAVFSYLTMVRQCGPKEHIYKEIQLIEENDFRFLEQTEPTRYVTDVCENMQLYPVHEYLTGDSLMFSYEPDVLKEFIEMFVPEKVSLCLVSDDFKATVDSTEPWFGTQYQQCDIDPRWIEKWSRIEPLEQFHLPEHNEFIATDFSLKEIDPSLSTRIPTSIYEDQYSTVYLRQDDKFKMPKAHYYFHLITPYIYESPRRMALLDLYINLLHFNLSEVAYAANVAQLNYNFRSFETGMSIQVWGYNHKLQKLFEVVLDHATNFTCDEEAFNNMKRQLKKSYHNLFIKPENLVRDVRLQIIKPIYWSPLDKNASINDITRQDLMTFVEELRNRLYVESYISGNVTKEEALTLNQIFKDKLKYQPLPSELIPKPRVYQLPEGSTICRIRSPLKNDDNCVITNYYQIGPGRAVSEMCINEMLVMAMEEPCFNILRTRLQLGYSVFTTNRNTDQVLAFSVTVCSKQSKFSLDVLNKHMENFVQEFHEILSNMSDEEFQVQVNALINLKRCEDSNLKEKIDRDWEEVLWRRYMFNRLDLEIEELRKLTRMNVLDHLRKHSAVGEPGPFRKLSVQVQAQNCTKENTAVKNGTASLKKREVDDETKQNDVMDGISEDDDGSEDEDVSESEDESENEESDTEEEECKLDLITVEGRCVSDIQEFKKNLTLYDHIVVNLT